MNVNDQVKAFDSTLYKNDIETPITFTMRLAMVKKVYQDKEERDVADVLFIHSGKISHGHFIETLELYK